jgi:hypothetical protein
MTNSIKISDIWIDYNIYKEVKRRGLDWPEIYEQNVMDCSTLPLTSDRLDSILNEMNLIGVDIQKNIDYLNEISIILNVELDIYRKENKHLEGKVKNVESVDTTSQGLMDDYTDLYKNQRSYNIGMVITFVIAFFINDGLICIYINKLFKIIIASSTYL